ncbi:MAG TPA: ArsA family ATPase, partial [Oryzihumus sp.]|nr:ArsA family ATPase [Oryzihumus sp.]
MRVLLFTGKGGVGKTTTAAATAVHAARQGIKTLVMSTDAAHSLGDALDVDLTPRESSGECLVEVEPGLAALQVSAPHAMRRSWRSVQDYLLGVLATVGVDAVVAEELTSLPGAEEVVALLELRAQVESGRFDLVVVDCAPTAEALRLLALPEALSWHLERLLPAQRGLLRSLR